MYAKEQRIKIITFHNEKWEENEMLGYFRDKYDSLS